MNGIINHLGGAVSTVNDMVDAFDSFATNGGWFVPTGVDTGRTYQQFGNVGKGRFIGYWYTQSSNGNSAWVKVEINNVINNYSASVAEIFTLNNITGATGIELRAYSWSNPSVMGINWEQDDGNYNTIFISGITFKISD